MMRYTYLLVDLACILIPFLASYYPKHAFYKHWKFFFKANIIVAVLFIIWDYFFTKIGVWGFNPDYLSGYYFTNLPVEELFFFICIPYACVFSFFAFQHIIKQNPLQNFESILTNGLIIILLVTTIFNYDKLYTLVTFLSTSLFLMYLKYKKVNLANHYLSYFFILPFFFISNGILTGSFGLNPIVWYNDSENLGLRIANIPIEDTIYGLLLIFMNIELYCCFKGKSKQKTTQI